MLNVYADVMLRDEKEGSEIRGVLERKKSKLNHKSEGIETKQM